MTTYVLILLALIQGTGSHNAKQQYLDDYKEIVNRYKGASNISYNIKFKSFDTRADKPDTVLTGSYACKGAKLYSRIGFAETFINDKYVLKIDNAHKVAFINYARTAKNEALPTMMLDSVIRKFKCSIDYVDLPGDIRRYKIEYPETADHNATMLLEFYKKTHLISKLTMYLAADEDPYEPNPVKNSYKPFVEFVYSNYSFAEIPDVLFSVDKYVDVKGKVVKAKGAFANYQIINSLLYNKENR